MKESRRFVVVLTVIALPLILLLPACGRPETSPAAGELYSIETGDGTLSVVKVLVVDDDLVHIRLYKNRFTDCPEHVDTSLLSLGGIGDPDGFGIGHLPISIAEFESWNPQFLQSEPVTEEELDGYRMWQESVGE